MRPFPYSPSARLRTHGYSAASGSQSDAANIPTTRCRSACSRSCALLLSRPITASSHVKSCHPTCRSSSCCFAMAIAAASLAGSSQHFEATASDSHPDSCDVKATGLARLRAMPEYCELRPQAGRGTFATEQCLAPNGKRTIPSVAHGSECQCVLWRPAAARIVVRQLQRHLQIHIKTTDRDRCAQPLPPP